MLLEIESGYIDEVVELENLVHPYVVRWEYPFPRWISTPDEDLGTEWCKPCGIFKLRNLRRHDRKRRDDYRLDGGYRVEEDGFKCCCACGEPLDVSLTDYGVDDSIAMFDEGGFSNSTDRDAYEIHQLLGVVNYRYGVEKADSIERRARIVALARQFLEQAGAVPAKELK